MPLERILEPEVMDSAQDATDYDSMDHAAVNQVFVDDLLAVLPPAASPQSPAPSSQPPALLDVLDLGTGTALIPIELCRKFAGCRVMAADAAVSMLDLARYNIEVHGLIDRIELAQVDAKKLAFADEMFDVVMSNSIIHHIPEPIHVLREAIRVTRRGGLLFFRDLLRPNDEPELQRLVETYTPGANAHQQKMFAESLHAALSLDEIRSLVASLGFSPDSIAQTTDRHWTWASPRHDAKE